MRNFILITLLVFSLPVVANTAAQPAIQYRDHNMTLTLRVQPRRSPGVLKQIPAEHHSAFSVAELIWKGKPLQACWMLWPDQQNFLLIDETGDSGLLPISVFKPVTNV